MSTLVQFNLPPELRTLIYSFAYYSKEESLQRLRKKITVAQLDRCKRTWPKLPELDPYFDIFYYRMETYDYFMYSDLIYIEYYYKIMSAVFCKECHKYVSSKYDLPRCIECDCVPEFLGVD